MRRDPERAKESFTSSLPTFDFPYLSIKQELPIPLHSQNRRLDPFRPYASEIIECRLHLQHGSPLGLFIPHDPALAHQLAAHLKLWFDQYNDLTPDFLCTAKCIHQGRQHQRGRDERHIERNKINRLADLL